MTRKTLHLVALGAVLPIGGWGCVLGPGSIAAGRGVYNEVINATEDEQLLNMIVRERYNETYGMLAVASVTASIRASADVRGQWGLSRSLREDYVGQLVPLAAGMAFEENPTISYIPLGGEQFVQRLLSPLSLEEVLVMEQYLPGRDDVFTGVSIGSINRVPNPATTDDGTGAASFNRMVDLLQHLRRVGVLHIARASGDSFEVVIQIEDSKHEQALEEFLQLTGISTRPSNGRLVLPLQLATGGPSHEAFSLQTRSVLQIIRTAGACIEIPKPHLQKGIVEVLADKHEGRFMRIYTSRVRPGGEGTVAVRYRGWWYYVDDADPASKQSFLFLRTLVGLRLYKGGVDQAAPVLTIPVG